MKEQTCEYYLFVVTDSFGNKCGDVCDEMDDDIDIQPLKFADGRTAYFQDDAKHLESWCKEHGFHYEERRKVEVL